MSEERQVPEGLKQLASTMDAGAFACFLSLFNWAKQWQRLYDAGLLDADMARAMMMWLTGVGADPHSWLRHAPKVGGALENEISTWVADAVYKDANPMPWLIVSKIAPALAGSSKSFEHQIEAHRVVGEHFTAGEIPDVPELNEIVNAVTRARGLAESAEAAAGTAGARATAPNQPSKGLPAGSKQSAAEPGTDPLSGLGAAVRRNF